MVDFFKGRRNPDRLVNEDTKENFKRFLNFTPDFIEGVFDYSSKIHEYIKDLREKDVEVPFYNKYSKMWGESPLQQYQLHKTKNGITYYYTPHRITHGQKYYDVWDSFIEQFENMEPSSEDNWITSRRNLADYILLKKDDNNICSIVPVAEDFAMVGFEYPKKWSNTEKPKFILDAPIEPMHGLKYYAVWRSFEEQYKKTLGKYYFEKNYWCLVRKQKIAGQILGKRNDKSIYAHRHLPSEEDFEMVGFEYPKESEYDIPRSWLNIVDKNQ